METRKYLFETRWKQFLKEQKTPAELGFQPWENGFILRLPKGSAPAKNVIRIQADPIDGKYNIMILVQGNKRTRSEIKGITVFKDIEQLLNSKFKRQDEVFDIIGGLGDMSTLSTITNKLKSLKIDETNNWFTL